jgi:uncharacterized Zn finger protein (UPF0148 family)
MTTLQRSNLRNARITIDGETRTHAVTSVGTKLDAGDEPGTLLNLACERWEWALFAEPTDGPVTCPECKEALP